MGTFIDDNGFICYARSGITLSNTHGNMAGHSEQHLREQEDVVNAIIDKRLEPFINGLENQLTQLITEICANVWNDVAQRTLSAFTQETHTAVNIAFNDGLDILRSEKTRRFITDNIAKQAQIELSKIKPIIKL